jgi:hypothetical protein
MLHGSHARMGSVRQDLGLGFQQGLKLNRVICADHQNNQDK